MHKLLTASDGVALALQETVKARVGFTGQSGHHLPCTCKEGLSLALMQELQFKSWCFLDSQAVSITMCRLHMSMWKHTITEDSINGSESESDYISSSHIRLIRCLAVIGQASCTREHLV